MNWQGRIIINPDILVGKPVIKGTRLSVEFILDLLAQRWSENDIIENYPGITPEDIKACLSYARDALKKPDYKNMTRKELKEHLLTHRTDEEAWSFFFEKLSELDPNQGYPNDLSDQEMEEIFREKLNQS